MFPHIISHLVISCGVIVQFFLGNLSYIAQSKRGYVVGVLTDAPALYVESRKLEQFLLKHAGLFRSELGYEKLVGIRRISGIFPPVAHIGHTLLEIFARNAKRPAQVDSIYIGHFARNHSDIIRRLVVDQQIAVPVKHVPTCRILHPFQKSITVGISLVIIVQDLQTEQPYYIYEYDQYRYAAYNIFAILIYTVTFRHIIS